MIGCIVVNQIGSRQKVGYRCHLQEFNLRDNERRFTGLKKVSKTMINSKQFTILFHIDDLLMSNLSPKIVIFYIRKLEKEYGTKGPLTMKREKVHEYLDMMVDFCINGEVMFSQYDSLKRLYNSLPKGIFDGYKNTETSEYLFKTLNLGIFLNKDGKEEFHTTTANKVWLSQRLQPGTQLVTRFFCTSVQAPDEYDWKKLVHLLWYLWKNRFLPLIIQHNGKNTIIYIDGAHAVHSDCKRH